MILRLAAYLVCGGLAVLLCFALYCRRVLFRAPSLRQKRKGLSPRPPVVVGFFHPYCNSGGGGERVLWCALRALEAMHEANLKQQQQQQQQQSSKSGKSGGGAAAGPPLRAVVYTGDVGVTPAAMVGRAKERFGVALTGALPLEFVTLRSRHLVEASRYPRCTMVGQSLGSMALAWEALRLRVPHVFVDTTGYAFTFVVARALAACRVAAYVRRRYRRAMTD